MKIKHDENVRKLGIKAREKGLPKSANPYLDGTDDSDYWNEGWDSIDDKTIIAFDSSKAKANKKDGK